MSNYLNGSVSAFEELYRRHRQKVFAMALEHAPDTAHAEQVVQLVFRRLHKVRKKFDTRYTVAQHLFVITRFEIIQLLKRTRRFKAEEWSEISPNNQETTGDFQADMKVRMNAITPEEMDVLTVRFQDGLAFAEIADKLGIFWTVT